MTPQLLLKAKINKITSPHYPEKILKLSKPQKNANQNPSLIDAFQ